PRHWPEMLRSIRWMRRQNFDLVIDLQCLARSGTFAWFASGKLLVGLDEVREGARGFYDIAVRRPSYHTHAVDWYLETLKALQVPVHENFDWIPARPAIAAELKQKFPVGTGRWIILQPGARWLNKRWPIEHFAELVKQMSARLTDVRFAILGGESDRELGAAIAKAEPQRCLDLTGKITLPEMIECIRLSALMITNDTGPMHVAAALKKPVIGLFGPTEPRRTGPYGQLGNVLQGSTPCLPCMKPDCTFPRPVECLRMISPSAVFNKALRHLNYAHH
ncbi:MAG TPA: glycosyltransferase family 9 protein, partial [Candidatus Paceibacterota bacterium]|nr:glycosyltransferase family 9 protein [Candidatus Paceibacterota bacterium]